MSSDYRKGIVQQVTYYLSNGVLLMLASFISFPIWTRAFSISDYGIMNIATTTITLVVTFSKFGIQHAILRFYSEFKERKREDGISHLYTTALMGSIYIGLLLSGIFLLGIVFFFTALDTVMKNVLLMIAVIAYLDNIKAICFMFLRAEQKAQFYSVIGIVDRYGQLGLSLLFVLILRKGITGYLWGFILMDGIIAAFLFITYLRQNKIVLHHFSVPLLKELIAYGFPLIGFEFFNNVNKWGDRYIIQYFLGSAAVGLYSVPYNLSNMASNIFANPLRLASMPAYMGTWEKDGKEETEKFLGMLLKYYLIICIPIIVCFSIMSQDIIRILASEKYKDSYYIVPYVIIGMILSQGYFIYGAGLYLKKLTKTLMIINLASAVFNVILNIFLIPKYGLLGAAITTLLTYILRILLMIMVSMATIRIRISLSAISLPLIMSMIMGVVIFSIKGSAPLDLVIKSSLGIVIYSFGLLVLDESLRSKVISMLQRAS